MASEDSGRLSWATVVVKATGGGAKVKDKCEAQAYPVFYGVHHNRVMIKAWESQAGIWPLLKTART